MIRKFSTALAVVLAVLALSATPAQARPGEPGDRSYLGPLTGAHFAGHRVTACAFTDPGVFILPGESCIGRW